MADIETAARLDGPAPETVSPRAPLRRLALLNLPPIAVLAALGHAGYLDQFIDDPMLGAWCGGIVAVFVWAVAAFAWGNDDLSTWLGRRLVQLGMLGTLHGFVLAFAAVGLAGDLAATKEAIVSLTIGLSVALYTTIFGLVCKMWLDAIVRWCRK